VLTVLSIFAATSLFANETPSTKFVLNVDYARFKYDDKSFYLEIYYGFYPKLVTLRQTDGTFSGAVILKTTLSDAATNTVLRTEHALLPIQLSDTTTGAVGNFLTQAGYALPFGEYRLTVTAVDSLDPTRGDSIEMPITLQTSAQLVTTSDLELCSEIKSSEDKGNAFYKNSLEVVPNASLLYGVTGNPVVFHYVELYNLDPAKKYAVRTQLIDPVNKVVRDVSRPRTFRGATAVDVGTVNVTLLSSGKYNFVFSISEDGGAEVARTQKSFYIYNPHIQAAQATPAEIKGSELSGLTTEELAAEFRQAQYLATQEDKATFSKLSNAEGMREFLANFWVEAEQGKPGRLAVRRSDYLRRVSTANLRYKNQGREGWMTDRGRVFILYGDPDEMERVPSQNNAKPHEIWHYYQVENGVQFVFVDRSGFNDYVLVHSTKRGELQDDTWQRFLQ
jgi:GWxTD domain-containing protein